MLVKEGEVKKNIMALLNNLKAKEKIMTDRRDEVLAKLAELATR